MNEMDDMDSEPSFQEGLRSLCKMAGVELSGDEDGHENEPVDVKMKEVKVAPMNVIPSINIASKTSSVDDGGYEGMETRSASPQELEDLYPADYRGSPELDVVQEFVMPADMTIEININKLLEELKKADPFENQNSNKRHQLSDVKKKILDHHDLRRRLEIRDNERDEHIKMGVEFLQYRAELTSRMPENKLAMVSTKVLTCLKNMLEITFSEMLLSLACFMEITASHSRKFEDYLHLEKDLIIQILPEIEFMV
ncbi:hypothetical protein CRE_24124 [Caenorhabditis remanei]|uniref:Uncharacterized protein n=2 Tax=Caenorhabditis remanei TaxID=31234 RepID=E3MVQ0_CAERE|nr:hypothetical protein CRE_24124 [Caenorhabditis remanei]